MAVSKVILNGTTLIDTTDKTVTSGSMLSGVTALKNDGTTATGSIASKSSTDLTVSGATVTAPAGYYASSASKSVASGSAGTPTASKGSVSNHSVSVTPSVTNTTGYISGGAKTGTAVTVSASELVSGTKSITANGTGIDVANYAAVDVNVSGSSVDVQALSVTENGTYTAPSGTAYSPVTVNVSGGGGGSSYTLLASQEFEVSTTSTSETSLGYFSSPDTTFHTKEHLIYVRVRDKAGRRNGYCYGGDYFFCDYTAINGADSLVSYRIGFNYYIKDDGTLNTSATIRGTEMSSYGVYPAALTKNSGFTMKAKWLTSTSGTIDGTYLVEAFFLDWPNGELPFGA